MIDRNTGSYLGICCAKGCCGPAIFPAGICKECFIKAQESDIRFCELDLITDIKNASTYVYFIYNEDSVAVKIGKSNHPLKRLNAIQTSSPSDLKILTCMRAPDVLELKLHDHFRESRIRGEWFRLTKHLADFLENILDGKKPEILEDHSVDMGKAIFSSFYFGQFGEYRKGERL